MKNYFFFKISILAPSTGYSIQIISVQKLNDIYGKLYSLRPSDNAIILNTWSAITQQYYVNFITVLLFTQS